MQILVVDDDPMAGEMTGAILEDAGHQVVLAENGVEALERLTPAIELVVSDLNMPMVSGIELFRELRGQGVTVPFVLLSGDDPAAVRREEPALDACIPKDAEMEQALLAAIAAIQARSPQ
jgi:CheY-like chemotaxis protein